MQCVPERFASLWTPSLRHDRLGLTATPLKKADHHLGSGRKTCMIQIDEDYNLKTELLNVENNKCKEEAKLSQVCHWQTETDKEWTSQRVKENLWKCVGLMQRCTDDQKLPVIVWTGRDQKWLLLSRSEEPALPPASLWCVETLICCRESKDSGQIKSNKLNPKK